MKNGLTPPAEDPGMDKQAVLGGRRSGIQRVFERLRAAGEIQASVPAAPAYKEQVIVALSLAPIR